MSTKRKLEDEDDDDEDINNSVTTLNDNNQGEGIVKKQKSKKNVRFDDVTVYYFARSQGFVSVPSQGTVTLGMVSEHSHVEQYSVADFSRHRRAIHKSILRDRKLLPPSSSSIDSDDEDEPLPVDDYYFIQPIAARQRRTLLKQAGLDKIDATEKQELSLIRRSREVCGCSCTRETGGCQPLTCECYQNGIACQVDRLTFPCPCATMLCKNPLGRLEFNQNRVRNHFLETITRLATEKEQEGSDCLVDRDDDLDDFSVIEFLLSSMISQIESKHDEITSVLDDIVSSIDESMMFIQEFSTTSPYDTDTTVADFLPTSPVNDFIQTETICHLDSPDLSLSCKLSSSIEPNTMISNELL